MSTRIARELAWGNEPLCVFLTDGSGHGHDPRVREAESRRVLTGLGVPEANLLFVGSAHGIRDGHLVEHLEQALALLQASVAGRPIRRVYCTAYEGGHQDHDAAHLVAVTFAAGCRLLHRCWQLPYYHGYRMPWRLFRVHSPLPKSARTCVRRLPLREAIDHTLLGFRYRSQWRTWLGILPEFLFQRMLLRREPLAAVDVAALRRRPHEGTLLYETLFGFSHEAFRKAADPFLAGHLPGELE